MSKSAIKLYNFQKKWLNDTSRFKIGNMSRQVGKSFVTSLEAVLDAAETGDSWVLLSAGERQSKELMSKVKMHCEALKLAAGEIESEVLSDMQCTQLTVRLPNGARIIGLPANPDTARGFSANVLLDEFAFHKDSDKIWAALFPTISRGFKLRIVSTPQGKSNRFYTLFSGDNEFSKHLVTIEDAVNDGVPHDLEQLKKGVDDDDAWQQEFMCQFLDEATAFLTYELISSCESENATITHDEVGKKGQEFYIGVDVGRKKDLTVIWVLEKVGDVYWTREIETLRKQQFSVQANRIALQIKTLNARRCCIDATGLGMQLAEELGNDFGSYTVEPVMFTNAVKNDLATRTLRIFQDRRVRIPVSTKIRNDLHSVKKTVTSAGNIRFDAERTKDGHADRFWALALAFMASDEGAVKPEVILI